MSYSSSTFSELKAKASCYIEYRTFSDTEIDILFRRIENWIRTNKLYNVFRFIIGLMWMINKLVEENKSLRLENRKLIEENSKTQVKIVYSNNEWIDNGHPSKDWNKVYDM